jgi:hypothetical protein
MVQSNIPSLYIKSSGKIPELFKLLDRLKKISAIEVE